jgi:hypothetical protein
VLSYVPEIKDFTFWMRAGPSSGVGRSRQDPIHRRG